jgi:hypothetical protein
MRPLLAAGPPDGHPALAPACQRRWRHPQPAPSGCLWRQDIEGNPGTAAQAAHGQHSPVPKIPGIHRELPGPIVAIRQPASL